jgi:hypothetical protein
MNSQIQPQLTLYVFMDVGSRLAQVVMAEQV